MSCSLTEVPDELIVGAHHGLAVTMPAGRTHHAVNRRRAGRRGRSARDYTVEAVTTRLAKYHSETAPIPPFWYTSKGILRRVDGVGDPGCGHARIQKALAMSFRKKIDRRVGHPSPRGSAQPCGEWVPRGGSNGWVRSHHHQISGSMFCILLTFAMPMICRAGARYADMFPYPSGDGHASVIRRADGDRCRRAREVMMGFNVLRVMGWGQLLAAEAGTPLSVTVTPSITARNITTFKGQLKKLGLLLTGRRRAQQLPIRNTKRTRGSSSSLSAASRILPRSRELRLALFPGTVLANAGGPRRHLEYPHHQEALARSKRCSRSRRPICRGSWRGSTGRTVLTRCSDWIGKSRSARTLGSSGWPSRWKRGAPA